MVMPMGKRKRKTKNEKERYCNNCKVIVVLPTRDDEDQFQQNKIDTTSLDIDNDLHSKSRSTRHTFAGCASRTISLLRCSDEY